MTPSDVKVSHINGDGFLDLVIANEGSNDITILLGMGNTIFVSQAPIPVGLGSVSVEVVDVNGDGIPELVTANKNSNSVSVSKVQGDAAIRRADSAG